MVSVQQPEQARTYPSGSSTTATDAPTLRRRWSVVPSARRTLAKEKRAGPFNDYLVGLQQDPSSKKVERWFYTDYLRQLERRQELARGAAAKRAAAGSNATTVLQQKQGSPEQLVEEQQPASNLQQEPPQTAVDADKQPSFWSLDNPILATAALLGAIALVSSILH